MKSFLLFVGVGFTAALAVTGVRWLSGAATAVVK